MLVYDSQLHSQCETILQALHNRDRAMFRRIAYLAIEPKAKCCYSKIENLGAVLGQYGYKKIGRTQSKVAFGNLKRLNLFHMDRPNRRAAYRIRMKGLGEYLYAMLSNRIIMDILQKPTFETAKTDLREIQKPTHLDPDQIKKKDHPINILPSTTTERCNYINTRGDNTFKMESVLNSVPEKLRDKIIYEFNLYSSKNVVANKGKCMEVIAQRIVREQSEIDKIAREDRERSLRIQAETLRRRMEEDAIVQYSPEQKMAIIRKSREALKGMLYDQIPRS